MLNQCFGLASACHVGVPGALTWAPLLPAAPTDISQPILWSALAILIMIAINNKMMG